MASGKNYWRVRAIVAMVLAVTIGNGSKLLGPGSKREINELADEKKRLVKRIADFEKKNSRLSTEVRLFKESKPFQEWEVRSQLGYVKPNDVVVVLGGGN